MSKKVRIEARSSGWSAVEYGWRLKRHSHAWRPPTDVCETNKAYIVDVEIAGMKGNEFNIRYEDNVLSVRGNRPERGGPRSYHQMEIAYGEFSTEVKIPGPVDAEAIEAVYKDGFLKIILPKRAPARISLEDHSG